jgi:DNA-directed RNA polymerase beta subunit
MNIQDNGAAPERVDFSKIKTSIPIPNLIEVQKTSYERFLQMDLLPNEREDIGLQTVFNSVFPRRQRPGVRRLFHRQLGMQVRQPERAAPSSLDLPELWRHHPHRSVSRRRRPLPSLRHLQ